MVKDCITCSKTIRRSYKDVWKYFTRSQHLQKWFIAGARIEPIIGGTLYEPWCDEEGNVFVNCARIIEIKRNHYLKIAWPEQHYVTSLEIWFVAAQDKTKIRLKHSNFSQIVDLDRDYILQNYQKIWQDHLHNLQKYAERNEAKLHF